VTAIVFRVEHRAWITHLATISTGPVMGDGSIVGTGPNESGADGRSSMNSGLNWPFIRRRP